MGIKGLGKAIALLGFFIMRALAIEVGDFESLAINKSNSLKLYQQNKFLKRIVSYNGVEVNFALVEAAQKGCVNMVGLLLNQELKPQNFFNKLFYRRQLRITQNGMNQALISAAGEGHAGVVRMLVNRSYGKLIPNKIGMVSAYRKAVEKNKIAIVRILTFFVPTTEWHTTNHFRFHYGMFEFSDEIFMPAVVDDERLKPLTKPSIENYLKDPTSRKKNESGLDLIQEVMDMASFNKSCVAGIA